MTAGKRSLTLIILRKTVICLAFAFSFGSVASAQEFQQQEEQSQSDFRPNSESTSPQQGPVIGGGLWGSQPEQPTITNPINNSAESDDINSNVESIGSNGVSEGGRGGIRRTTSPGVTREAASGSPASGGTNDFGGNPDVPFDKNLNIVFLFAGLLFAILVVRNRLFQKNAASGK